MNPFSPPTTLTLLPIRQPFILPKSALPNKQRKMGVKYVLAGVDEVVFLRPLFPRLSVLAGYGIVGLSEQVREQGSRCWGPEDPASVIYLTSQCWNSLPGASLIPRVIPLGRKLV